MLRKRMGHALQRQGLPAWVVARPGPHVLAWISLIGIYPNLQYSNSQTSGPPTPVGHLGTWVGAQAGTVQPIRACPEDPWGCPSSTSALEASSPGRRRQRNSIGRQARSPQARRLTLHRPVLNPDPTLCPSERLSPALAVNNAPIAAQVPPLRPDTSSWSQSAVRCCVDIFLNDPAASGRLATAADPVSSRPQPGRPVAASDVEVKSSRVPPSSRLRTSMFECSLRSSRRGI